MSPKPEPSHQPSTFIHRLSACFLYRWPYPVPSLPHPTCDQENGLIFAHGPLAILPSINSSVMGSPKSSRVPTWPVQYLAITHPPQCARHNTVKIWLGYQVGIWPFCFDDNPHKYDTAEC